MSLRLIYPIIGLLAVSGVVFSLIPSSRVAGNPNMAEEIRSGTAMLDGMAFEGMIGPADSTSVPDRFEFADGKFLSRECERRCDYPASAYFVREVGERIEFFSETACPSKDATIVWRGIVNGNRIEGVSVWTSRRWYWTIERELEFSGEIIADDASVARSQ